MKKNETIVDNSNLVPIQGLGVAIEVKNLYKNYYPIKSGEFAGLGRPAIGDKSNPVPLQGLGVSFEVNRGEIFGIIGPDGAGKTTLFRILTTLILANSGTASVDGFDVVNDYKEIRKRVGYMPGKFSLYQDLTVEENLNFFATVFNTTIEENYELIKDIYQQIEPFKKRRAGKLSGGMKQKLALSCALIHKPSVLFLDEPTTGVDPVSRKEFWGMLKSLREQGITILVSTPYMDEASLCDRIALIQNGQFLKIETPENIVAQYENKLWAVESDNMHKLLIDLRNNEMTKNCFAFGDKHHVSISNEQMTIENLKEYLMKENHTNIQILEIEPTVEDCFMQLSQK
ncbi:MAG: ABC transporter ATP-binding protein [Paludibacter sp.]|nr:ABC transporter ATP-binding protein [Paludibacter sp.]